MNGETEKQEDFSPQWKEAIKRVVREVLAEDGVQGGIRPFFTWDNDPPPAQQSTYIPTPIITSTNHGAAANPITITPNTTGTNSRP